MYRLLYISTNAMWSGSEELWSRSAKLFLSQGHAVYFATKYNHPELTKLNAPNLNFYFRYAYKKRFKRLAERYLKVKFGNEDFLKNFIQEINPDYIIISQGNNFESLDLMQICKELGKPYITISQLVTDVHIPYFNNENIKNYQAAYLGALKNFFISKRNLKDNNLMLGIDLPNAEAVYNPCKLLEEDIPAFPEEAGVYNIGLVGRIECLHKGYDVLLQVLSAKKWKERPVTFNIYGEGPHINLIKENMIRFNISNINFRGHESNISTIWKENKILCMPSRMEGQALALIEAMFCQRAAVVTDVGGAAELIDEGESGFIAEAPTPALLDAALERAWTQRDRWKELGLQAATSLKRKYPVDAVDYFNKQVERELG